MFVFCSQYEQYDLGSELYGGSLLKNASSENASLSPPPTPLYTGSCRRGCGKWPQYRNTWYHPFALLYCTVVLYFCISFVYIVFLRSWNNYFTLSMSARTRTDDFRFLIFNFGPKLRELGTSCFHPAFRGFGSKHSRPTTYGGDFTLTCYRAVCAAPFLFLCFFVTALSGGYHTKNLAQNVIPNSNAAFVSKHSHSFILFL